MVRTAVVGLGGIAAEHLDKLARLDDVEVVGICDLSRTIGDAVAERWGVGPVFTDYEAMLADARPDVVHVLTPPQTHRPMVVRALESGAHVVVEKPMSVSWDDYMAMRDASRAAGRLLIESYNYLHGDVVRDALATVASGGVGRVLHVTVRYGVPLGATTGPYADRVVPHFAHSLPGGALLNFVTHPAYMLLAFMGPYTDLRVHRRTVGSGLSDDELRALVWGPEATGALTLSGHIHPMGFDVQVEGTDGVLTLDVADWTTGVARGEGPGAKVATGIRSGVGRITGVTSLIARTLAGRHDWFQGLDRLLTDFYAAVQGRGPVPITIEEMDMVNALSLDLVGARDSG